MRTFLGCLAVVAISGMAFVNPVGAEEEKVALDKLPKAVTDAVKKMFPKAELIGATKEEEDKEIEYEVTVKDGGKKIDITVDAKGKIEGLEKEVDLKDLPKAVTQSLEKNHPKALQKSAEAVYEIEEGKEELEYYEVQVETSDKKKIEVKIKADGKIVTDKGDEKEDEDDDKEDKK
jgi:uncharacterized membrane protein YkoI